jgi:hypothetical protein
MLVYCHTGATNSFSSSLNVSGSLASSDTAKPPSGNAVLWFVVKEKFPDEQCSYSQI